MEAFGSFGSWGSKTLLLELCQFYLLHLEESNLRDQDLCQAKKLQIATVFVAFNSFQQHKLVNLPELETLFP